MQLFSAYVNSFLPKIMFWGIGSSVFHM